MKKTMKWINGAASVIFILAVTVYLFLRPIIVQNLEPALQDAAAERLNGTITWSGLDLDPSYDVAFTDLELKDAGGETVFSAPSLTVRWTLAAAFDAWKEGKDVTAMIGDVIVENPSLHIREKADKSWNVQNLLKPEKDETPSAFKGRVLLKTGSAHIALQSGESYALSGLEGQFSWLNPGKMDAVLDGTFSKARFHASMTYEDENHFQGEAEMDPLPLTALEPLLSRLPAAAQEVEIKDGTGQVTRAKVWRSGGNLSYHIAGRLQDAALDIQQYALTDGAAFFDIYDGWVRLTDASALVNGERISAEGTLSWKDGLETDLSVALHEVHLENLLPGEDLAGIVTGDVRVTGAASDPDAAGRAAFRSVSLRGRALPEGSADFSWHDRVLSLSGLSLRMDGGRLSGSGSYDSRSGAFSAEGGAEDFPIAPLLPEGDLSGFVTGDFAVSGVYGGGAAEMGALSFRGEGRQIAYGGVSADLVSGSVSYDGSRYSARFYGEGLAAEGIRAESLYGEAEGDGRQWEIPCLYGTMGQGAFSLRGTYGEEAVRLSARGSGIDAAPLAAAAGENAGGILSFDGEITGTAAAPRWDGTLFLESGHFRGAPVRGLRADLSADRNWLTIRRLQMDTETGRHSLTGRIGLSGDHALSLAEESDHTRIENILKLAGLDYPVTGWMKNQVSIGGTLSNPSVQGHIMAWDGSAAGELYQSLSADYRLQNGILTIENGMGYIYEGAVAVSGTVSEDAVNLDASLVDVETGRILRGRPVSGRVTLRGHVTGSLSDPVFTGYGESREVTVNGASLSRISASLLYQGGMLRVTDGVFHQREGTFQWSGLINAQTGAVNGRLQFTRWDLGEALRAFQIPAKQVTGSMDGGMTVEGTLSDPNVSLQVKLNSGGTLGSAVMGEGRADLSYMNGILSLREMKIPVGGGILAAEGTAENGGALNIEAAARDMDISWIPQVMGREDLSIGGRLTAGVHLSGTRGDPRADISISVDHPSYSGIELDSLSIMGNMEDGVFHLDQLLGTKDIYRAAASGTMPSAALTGIPDGRQIPYNIDINLDKADLNALLFFAKPVTSANGPIEGHLKVTGAYDDPEVRGSVVIRDGSLTLESMGEPLAHILAQLDFKGKEAALIVNAEAGGGTIGAAGHLYWDHMAISHYDAEADVHVKHLDSVYYKGQLDANLFAGSERGLPKIYGTVDIANATADIPLSLESGGAGPDILMDVTVNVGDKVRLYNSLLYDMMVRGNIHAMGLMSRPVMSGRVNVEKGTVRYLSNEFTVTDGTAVWGGVPDSFLPVLSIAANTTVGHYKVGMELKGPPGDFQFKLRSEPSLTDSQIVTLLTLRQAPGSENDAAAGALFNAGLQMMFSGGVQDFLRDSFGLDMVSVTSALNDSYVVNDAMSDDFYYIKIGKYLFNDFMLTATMGLNNDQQSFGFRYDLKSRVGLAAWYNNDHDAYIGADYQFRF